MKYLLIILVSLFVVNIAIARESGFTEDDFGGGGTFYGGFDDTKWGINGKILGTTTNASVVIGGEFGVGMVMPTGYDNFMTLDFGFTIGKTIYKDKPNSGRYKTMIYLAAEPKFSTSIGEQGDALDCLYCSDWDIEYTNMSLYISANVVHKKFWGALLFRLAGEEQTWDSDWHDPWGVGGSGSESGSFAEPKVMLAIGFIVF